MARDTLGNQSGKGASWGQPAGGAERVEP